MYAIRSYYAHTADGRNRNGCLTKQGGKQFAGILDIILPVGLSLPLPHLPGVRVITSYSIHYTKLYDMLDVNRAFEMAVKRDPANWFWVHNRWKRGHPAAASTTA